MRNPCSVQKSWANSLWLWHILRQTLYTPVHFPYSLRRRGNLIVSDYISLSLSFGQRLGRSLYPQCSFKTRLSLLENCPAPSQFKTNTYSNTYSNQALIIRGTKSLFCKSKASLKSWLPTSVKSRQRLCFLKKSLWDYEQGQANSSAYHPRMTDN